jgi:hypothetical protein
MKKVIALLVVVFCISSALAQVWTYDSDFAKGTQPHGVLVDNQDRLWIGFYGPADTVEVDGKTIAIDGMRIYNPDGSQAEFSPIWRLSDGSTFDDTLDWAGSFSCRGISLAADGNVLFCGSAGKVYKVNSQTGEGMAKIITPTGASPTKAVSDENGFVYVTGVVSGGNPIWIYDEDLELYSVVTDSNFAISRAMTVSADGNDVYLGVIYGGDGNNGIIHYVSDDGSGPDGTYTAVDTLLKNVWAGSSMDVDHQGLVWAGSYWDIAATDWTGWFALDPTQNFGIVDTIGHGLRGPLPSPITAPGGTYYSPRGVAFSLDGKTAYTADFDAGVIKKWTNADPAGPGSPIILTSLRENGDRPVIVLDFSLDQNYPNPFNPTTNIPFEVAKTTHVKLVVYDINGRLVATLVDKELSPSHYEFEFDGSQLSSGTYFYQIEVDGARASKQMLLVK